LSTPSTQLQAALDAAQAAGEVIRSLYGRKVRVQIKPDHSPVTEADMRAEEIIRRMLSERCPSYGFYGEETGGERLDAEAVWLVDPLDGTKSFIRECPFFSTQIALLRAGRLVLGVSSAPLYRELAWAEEGCGAFLNGAPVRVSATTDFADAVISSGNLKSLAASAHSWQRFGALIQRVSRIRGYGDFVHYHLLARGALDIVLESDVNILDIAALSVIVREAGGRCTDLQGEPLGLSTTSVLATNGALHQPVLEALATAGALSPRVRLKR